MQDAISDTGGGDAGHEGEQQCSKSRTVVVKRWTRITPPDTPPDGRACACLQACLKIREELDKKGYSIPLCADMHFQPKVWWLSLCILYYTITFHTII